MGEGRAAWRGVVVAVVAAGAVAVHVPGASAGAAGNGRIWFGEGVQGELGSVGPAGGLRLLVPGGSDPTVSSDGTRVAYDDNGGIGVVNADGTGRHVIVQDGAAPSWSPDGTHIVFQRGSVDDLWVVAADGTGAKDLTRTPGLEERSPAWSPDGTTIAYTRTGCDPQKEGKCIFAMNADGSGQRDLTPETRFDCGAGPFSFQENSDRAAWSPDGRSIAFSGFAGCGGGSTDIWVMSANGSGKHDIVLDADTADDYPTWSPDGSRIAFLSDRTGRASDDLFTIAAGGGAVTQVPLAFASSSDYASDPEWAVAVTRRATTLSLTAVTSGGRLTLSGRLVPSTGSPYAGQHVTLQQQVPGSGTWTKVTGGVRTTSATGAYSLTLTPSRTLAYRAVYAANPILGLAASTSPVRTA